MFAMKWCTFLSLLLVSLLTDPSSAQHQYVVLYKQSGTCSSDILLNVNTFHVTTGGTVQPIITHPPNDASSALIFGMWQFGLCSVSTIPCPTAFMSYTTEVANQGRCIGLTPNVTWPAQPLQLVRLGGEFMNEGELHLYSDPNFDRVRTPTVITTGGASFSYSHNIQSYFFTGNHRWTLYEGAEFTGRSFCLRPNSDVTRIGYGFTHNPRVNHTIRSIKYACTGATHLPYLATIALSIIISFTSKL